MTGKYLAEARFADRIAAWCLSSVRECCGTRPLCAVCLELARRAAEFQAKADRLRCMDDTPQAMDIGAPVQCDECGELGAEWDGEARAWLCDGCGALLDAVRGGEC